MTRSAGVSTVHVWTGAHARPVKRSSMNIEGVAGYPV